MSVIVVILWFIIGIVLTGAAIQYANIIGFIGVLAIFILGIRAVVEAVKNIRGA